MKKLVLLLLLLPLSLVAKVPVEDDILEQITDPESQFYYPNLFLRFNNGDATLTQEDFHYLYYGFAYQSLYKPLEVQTKSDKVFMMATTIDPYTPTEESLQSLVIATTEALEQNPFSPNLWNLLAYAYGALGDPAREEMAFERVNLILKTIDSSGSGLKEREAKHIIMYDHAIDLLTSQGIRHNSAEIISRTVEFMPFVETQRTSSGKKIKGIYFDFGRIYWNKPDINDEPRKKAWQFNDLKPKDKN